MTEPVTTLPGHEESSAPPAGDDEKSNLPRPDVAAKYRRSHGDGERWLRTLVVIFSVGILLAIISGQAVKNGDIAAWLSMLFNGAMATAAVGAYLTARKWVPQLTTQEGYKLAIELVNEHYIYLGKRNPLLDEADQAMSCYRQLLENRCHTNSDDYASKIAILSSAIIKEEVRKDRFHLRIGRPPHFPQIISEHCLLICPRLSR